MLLHAHCNAHAARAIVDLLAVPKQSFSHTISALQVDVVFHYVYRVQLLA